MMHMRWLTGTLLLAAAASAPAADVIGRVLVAAGEVSAVRGGREVRLQAASPIEAGDRVRTGKTSNAQIRLTDESIVALRPESEFAFTEYRYGGSEDGSERAFFRLLKGGLRTITGLVGRRNHQNYRIETTTATVGIRGTHYVLMLCEQNCFNADGSRAPDGLYGNATGFSFGTNRVSATNQTGERVFGVNEPFHVPDNSSEPRRLIAPPDFLADKLTGRGRNQAKGPGTEAVQDVAGKNADGRAAVILPPPGALPEVVTEERDSAGQLAVLGTPLPGTGSGGVTYFSGASSSFSQGLVNASLTADAQGRLASFSDGQISGSATGGTTDAGSNSAAGNLHWGMWPVASVSGMPATYLHYIVGDAASLPGTGVFTYSPVGGTLPTNAAGVTGAFLGGTVTVDFTPGNLQLNNWAVAFNGATYTQSGGGAATFGRSPAFSNQVTWSCAGSSCGTTTGGINGNFSGSFTGTGATGVGIVYGIPDTGNNGQIIGAQGFKR